MRLSYAGKFWLSYFAAEFTIIGVVVYHWLA